MNGPQRLLVLLSAALLVALVWPAASVGQSAKADDNVVAPEDVEISAPVTDPAGLLTDDEQARLASRLVELRERTGIQMAILLVPGIGDTPIEEFSLQVARAWGGGSKERNDGVLLTLAVAERKSRFETGKGLEAVITDDEAATILESMTPELRKAEWAQALQTALDGVDKQTEKISPDTPLH